MIIIIWKGNTEFIPGYGVVSDGCQIELPKYLAESFIEQGKAVKLATKKSTKAEV